jgi:ABC-type dipeptide/oligopeptide/nickel transport system permease component
MREAAREQEAELKTDYGYHRRSATSLASPLSLAALTIAVAIGVPLGALAAIQPLSRFDNLVMTVTLFGVSMPIFWLGLMMILIFATPPAAGD